LVVFQSKREQDSLLNPLMDLPLPIDFLGNTQCASVKLFKYLLNRLAQVFTGITRVDTGPVFPGLFNKRLKLVHVIPD
jgi:hypothetical protein